MARDRHSQGSNLLYADWHVGHVKSIDVIKNLPGFDNPEHNTAGIDMWRFWK
jgi:prepilin-type processing-associated H-X9-DG protein